MTTTQTINQFLADLSLTDADRQRVSQRKDTIHQRLSQVFASDNDLSLTRTVLMGSAAKGTITRPVEDIDVLAVFSNSGGAYDRYRYNSQDFLYRIRSIYSGITTVKVGARGQAVRVFFKTGGYVDITPVFEYNSDIYYLPAGDGTWLTTAPLKGVQWYKEKNQDLSYRLTPLVKLLKQWNQSHSHRLNSFHLETMAASMFSGLSLNQQENLGRFFEWAPNYLDVSDPGGCSGNLSTYLGWNSRKEVMSSFETAALRAHQALEAEASKDYAESNRQWRVILGKSFPG